MVVNCMLCPLVWCSRQAIAAVVRQKVQSGYCTAWFWRQLLQYVDLIVPVFEIITELELCVLCALIADKSRRM